jgi:hypothetical protein
MEVRILPGALDVSEVKGPAMTDLIETVTTVPLVSPLDASPFWEGVLRESTITQPHLAAKRPGDPIWALVLVLLGALVSVGAGAFLITVGLSQ